MVEQEIEVINRAGIHTRPAASIVKTAAKFKADAYIVRDGFAINAKSIIGVMTLAAEQGSKLIIRTEGEEEQLSLKAIIQLFEEGFGEL